MQFLNITNRSFSWDCLHFFGHTLGITPKSNYCMLPDSRYELCISKLWSESSFQINVSVKNFKPKLFGVWSSGGCFAKTNSNCLMGLFFFFFGSTNSNRVNSCGIGFSSYFSEFLQLWKADEWQKNKYCSVVFRSAFQKE